MTLRVGDQLRLNVLMELERDRMTRTEAASALGITTRQVGTLRQRLGGEGAAGLLHRGRGRPPVNACEPEVVALVLKLWREKYEGFNQVHFTEMLERDEGILLARSTVRRLLAAASIPSARPQKRSRHRRHRPRRANEGAMIQMDGSPHDWLGDRGPRLTLVGGIDDATGHVWATFRLGEDTAGYFEVLREIVKECGVPLSVYTDLTAIALGTRRTPERVRTGTVHFDTQMTRVLNRLGIALIRARSPQAKGRIERLWKTLQDRLVSELRAQDVRTFAGAQQLLKHHLHFHNRNFGVAALDPVSAWKPLHKDLNLDDAICWTYRRTVTNANTVSVEGTRLQIEFPASHSGWANRRVMVSRRLDESWFVTHLGIDAPATPFSRKSARIAA